MDDVKRRSFAAGYLLGIAGLPVAAAPVQFDSEPTMCLYGKTPLPYLQWDQKTYPHAMVTYDDKLLEFKLVIYKKADYYQIEKPSMFGGTYFEHWFGTEEENSALVFSCKPGETNWSQTDKTSYSVDLSRYAVFELRSKDRVIWADFDLMFDDGSSYVSASKPEAIKDANSFNQKCYYNDVVLPRKGQGVDIYHKLAVMKHSTEDVYIYYDFMLGGLHYMNGEVYFTTDNIYTTTVYICPSGGDSWTHVDTLSYVENRPDVAGSRYFIGLFENLVWAEDGLDAPYGDLTGSDPVPVVIPESKPGAVNDNKLMMLGCRLGYIIRTHMGKGNEETDVPMGVLISSDGYILTDNNGVYLITKEDS